MERERLGREIWAMRVSLLRLAGSILHQPQDAEDAVSAAIVTAYQKAETLRDEGKLRPWLMTITARCCYDQLRRAQRERPVADVPGAQATLFTSGETLYDTLLELPPHLAQVLTLYYYEGFSTAEIAAVLGVGRTAVSMRLARGRRLLKEKLEGRHEA